MVLTSASEKDGERRRKAASQSAAPGQQDKMKARKKRPDGNELGTALRSAYQRTVEEAIPSDLLDLLGKLG